SCCARTYIIGRASGSLIIPVNYSGRYAVSMIPGVVPGTSVNYQGRSAGPLPDVFDGSLVQTLLQLIARGRDDGGGRRAALPPPDVAAGRMETGILDEHRHGPGNLYMALAPLRRAAGLAGGRAQVQFRDPSRDQQLYRQLFGGCWLPGEVGVDRIVQLLQLALAQILIRDLGEFLDDEIGHRGGITHRRSPETPRRLRAGGWRCRQPRVATA